MQEVLGALQGHLGSGQAAEVTAALGALLSLAHTHSQALLQHVGFASNLLDCLPSLTQAQVHQVTPVPPYLLLPLAQCISLAEDFKLSVNEVGQAPIGPWCADATQLALHDAAANGLQCCHNNVTHASSCCM